MSAEARASTTRACRSSARRSQSISREDGRSPPRRGRRGCFAHPYAPRFSPRLASTRAPCPFRERHGRPCWRSRAAFRQTSTRIPGAACGLSPKRASLLALRPAVSATRGMPKPEPTRRRENTRPRRQRVIQTQTGSVETCKWVTIAVWRTALHHPPKGPSPATRLGEWSCA